MKRFYMNARLFLEGAVLSYRALFRWFRPTTYAASKLVMPLSQMLFFTLIGTFGSGGKMNAAFFVIGNAMQITAVNGIYGVTMSIGGDRWNGTLSYLFGTPANRLILFFGRASVHLIDGIFGVAVAFLWGGLLLGLDISRANIGLLALAVFLTTFSTSGLGLLMGCVGLITRNVMFVNNTVYFLLLLFSGANIPPESLPAFIRIPAQFLPLTNGIAAARSIFAGNSFTGVVPFLLKETAIGVVYMLIGYAVFRWFEMQAKRRGSLETV